MGIGSGNIVGSKGKKESSKGIYQSSNVKDEDSMGPVW